MSTSVGLPRSGTAIRAVLAELAPDELPEFEAEFRCALAAADDDFDLEPVLAVIGRWWGRAHLRLYPATVEERAAVDRVRAGDFSGMQARDADGQWREL
ncbi:DUF6247 family protein [Mycobacteroides abscessus]|uniref:DUF6247 family protein n=1 Tax=Mycobacteroides abscessus TaxID=36809 RepID=UPI0010C9C473|nr:DUF6247 family protein [Mycobacteroides abscessus]TKV35321.1 hypothetical protein CFA71_23935 [Mycobacteroides abscessus subsp. bolletii]